MTNGCAQGDIAFAMTDDLSGKVFFAIAGCSNDFCMIHFRAHVGDIFGVCPGVFLQFTDSLAYETREGPQ
jgi:hypothetical protein